MNYIERTTASLAKKLPRCDPQLLRYYALLALVTGTSTTRKDVHDAWACWRIVTRPDHPDLVPFEKLSAKVQERDEKYVAAICQVAREKLLCATNVMHW